MATTHALAYEQTGDPKNVLKYSELPKPHISKGTEILIRVKASSVHVTDKARVRGAYGLAPYIFPAVGGSEGAGIVEEVGAAVKNVRVGQRIHFVAYSAWTEYVVFDTAALPTHYVVPDNFSFEEAAQLTVNPLTVFGLFDVLKLQKGDTLVQSAAGSTLGRILIIVAKNRGVKTINIVRRESQIAELKGIGADYVINSETEDVVAKIKELTGGAGAKYAVDSIGGGKIPELLVQALAPQGHLLIYGRLSQEPFAPNVSTIIAKGARIEGFVLPPWIGRHVQELPALYKEIVDLVISKTLVLEHKTFEAKAHFHEALDHSEAPGKSEKTILLF